MAKSTRAAAKSLKSKANATVSLTITGLPSNLETSPEKVRKILEALELPAGTKVAVELKATSTIVR